jgi:transcriptional regulator with XRE-family HTH domain
MPENVPIPLKCIALASLRGMRGLSREQVADRAGLSKNTVARYETSSPPSGKSLNKVLEALEYSLQDYNEIVATLARVAARASGPAPDVALPDEVPLAVSPVDPTPDEWREIHALAAEAGQEACLLTAESLAETVRERKAAAARAEAAGICALLEQEPMPWLVVSKVREVQTWAVAEALAHRSAEVAPSHVDRAMELAALACRVAELAPATEPFHESLLGYTLTFGENTLRAAGDLPEAEAVFITAEEHWKAGAAAPGPLQEWRRQSLASTLHRDQGRFAESLAHLNASLALAPDEARGSLLISKSLTLQRMGEPGQAIGLLEEAEQTMDRERDRDFFLIARFNRARLLCRLRRDAEAMLLLQEIEAMPGVGVGVLGSGLNHARLLWLRGSVAAGLGIWEDAETHLEAARRAFVDHRAAWELAQVSLELAVLFCRHDRTREIPALTRGLSWIIQDEKLSYEALAALRLVCEAPAGSLTLELAERAQLLLQRAPRGKKPGEASDLSAFHQAASARVEPSVVLAGGGSDGAAMAGSTGIDDAPAVPGLAAPQGIQEAGGRGPEGGDPGDDALREANRLPGSGGTCRQDG